MGFSIGDLYLTLLADGGRLRQSIEQEATKAADAAGTKVGQSLGNRIAKGFASAGKQMQATGTMLTRNVTAPILALGTAAVVVGTQFDTTMRQIVALTDVTADEIGGVRKRLLELGPVLGKTPQELAEGFYFLASAGFTTAEALEVLKTTAKASAAGLGTTADISRVIGSAINAYGKENITAAQATDQLIRAINKGTAEAPEFANSLGNVMGTAAQAGVTFGDTTAAIAGMTLAGIGTEEATTSLNQVLLSLIKTTPQAEAGLAAVGLSSAGLRTELREKGLLSVLQTLTERFAGNETAAADAFGNVRALRGVLALTGLDAEQLATVFNDVNNGTQNLADAFAETEGPGREMDRAMAEIQATLISLAEDVLPPFTEVLRAVVGLIHSGVEAFKSLPEPVRDGIVQVAALAAALGPLLFVTGKVTSGIGLLVGSLGKLHTLAGIIGPRIAAAVAQAGAGSAVAGAATAAGTTIGGLIAAAVPLALVAAAGVAIALAFKAIFLDPATQQQMRDIGKSAAEQIVEGTTEELRIGKAAIEKGIADLNALPFGGFLNADAISGLQAQLDAYTAELERRGERIPEAVAAGLDRSAHWVNEAIGEMYGPMTPSPEVLARLGAAAQKIPESIAAGVLARQNRVVDAMDTLRNLMKNALRPAQRATRGIGLLIGDELAGALDDKRGAVRKEAERVQAVAVEELAQIIGRGGKAGEKAMDALEEAIKHGTPKARRRAREVKEAVVERLEATKGPAGDAGEAAGVAFARNIRRAVAAGDFSVNASVGFTLPGHARGGVARAGQPAIFGEKGPEIGIPEADYRIFTHQQSVEMVRGANGGGDTYNIPVNVQGALPVRTARDIVTELRRISELGVLPAATLSPKYNRREATG